MTEQRKKAYRYLLYKATIMAKVNMVTSSCLLMTRSEKHYIRQVSAINYWLHNLALFNYTNHWQQFDERRFWQDYTLWAADFPDVFQDFKHQFARMLIQE